MDQVDPQLLYRKTKIEDLKIPNQACWMVKKVLGDKVHLHLLHNISKGKKSAIRQAYMLMLGNYPKVDWRTIICYSSARPKAVFTTWLQVQN